MSGRFVVIEGIDGSGTTTQAERLVQRLVKEGKPARVTAEPSNGPIGGLVRQVLLGRIVGAGGLAPGWATMALLFAADRMDHVESQIDPFLESGGVIISDRYDASSLAYQSVMSGRGGKDGGKEAVEWIRTLNRYPRRPDLTIVLDVSPSLAASRREARGHAAQLYEQNEMQIALATFYKDLAKHLPNDKVTLIDGSGGVEQVGEAVYRTFSA